MSLKFIEPSNNKFYVSIYELEKGDTFQHGTDYFVVVNPTKKGSQRVLNLNTCTIKYLNEINFPGGDVESCDLTFTQDNGEVG